MSILQGTKEEAAGQLHKETREQEAQRIDLRGGGGRRGRAPRNEEREHFLKGPVINYKKLIIL